MGRKSIELIVEGIHEAIDINKIRLLHAVAERDNRYGLQINDTNIPEEENYSKKPANKSNVQLLDSLYRKHTSKNNKIDYIFNNRITPSSGSFTTVWLPRVQRDYLLSDNYFELDIVNCIISILYNIILQNPDDFLEVEYNLMKKLTYEREEIFEKYSHINKSELKVSLICAFTNSKTNMYVEFLTNEEIKLIKQIRTKICSLEKYKSFEIKEKMLSEKKEINYGKMLSHIAFSYEKDIMCCLVDKLKLNGINYGAINFDGIYIKNIDLDEVELSLEEYSEFIEQSIDMKINFAIKEIKHPTNEEICPNFDINNFEMGEDDEKDPVEKLWNEMEIWASQNKLVRISKEDVNELHLYDEDIDYASRPKYNNFEDLFADFQRYIIKQGKGDLIENKGRSFGQKQKMIKENVESRVSSMFRIVKSDRRFIGYKNGVLNVDTNEFIKKENFNEQIIARTYFDFDYSILKPPDNSDLIKICKDQEWTEETINSCFFMLGRLWIELGLIDNLGLVINLFGASSTGKSTLLNAHIDCIEFSKQATIGTDRASFALYGKNNKELLSCHEAQKLFSGLNPETFKSMTRAEVVEVEGKGINKRSEKWTTPMFFCSQNSINIDDPSGAINGKRIVNFKFSHQIASLDTGLETRLKKDYKCYVGFFIDYYHKNKNNFSLSKQIVDWNNEIVQKTNIFAEFLDLDKDQAYNMVVYSPGSRLPTGELRKAFKNYCQMELDMKTAPPIDTHEQSYLLRMGKGVKYVHKENYCTACLETRMECKCENKKISTRTYWNNLKIVLGDKGEKKSAKKNGWLEAADEVG